VRRARNRPAQAAAAIAESRPVRDQFARAGIVPVHEQVCSARRPRKIARFARDRRLDLLAMGRTAEARSPRLLGSVASRWPDLQHARCCCSGFRSQGCRG